MKSKHAFLLTLVSIILVLWYCGDGPATPPQSGQVIPLGYPWKLAIPHQEVPAGLSSLSAAACGNCHQAHYQEWKTSTHAHAWTDPQFQAELVKESSPIMCINCHTPLQDQQEYMVNGLIDGNIYEPLKEKNPHFDKALQQEGINCASCHVRQGAVVGPIGTDKAPHRTVRDTIHLSEKLCISCHNTNAVVTPTLACTFQTGDEWKAGPYFGNKNCIACHMEKTQREIAPGYGECNSRFHTFAGSGIPKRTGLYAPMLNGLEFYPGNVAENYSVGDLFTYTFQVKNEHAGHRVPTGDPERFFLIHFELRNAQDSLVLRQQERIGEEWQWHPEAKKLSDNNLDPGEERNYLFKALMKRKGKYVLSIYVTKHRMTQEAAIYNKLGDDYPLFINIYRKAVEIHVE